jgi:hypothetical protein
MRRPLPYVVIAALALDACVIGSVGLAGHPCPCLSGYRCDETTNECVPADGGMGSDGPTDSGTERSHDTGEKPDSRNLDSAADDGLPPDAGGDWCSRQEAGFRLCSDFDLPDAGVDQGFDLGFLYTGSGGGFAFDNGTFVSPPRSAQGSPMSFGPGGNAGVQLNGSLWLYEPTPATVTCSLAWLPISIPTTAGVYSHVLFLSFYASGDAGTSLRDIGINIMNGDELQFLDAIRANPSLSTTASFGPFVPSSPPKWTQVKLTLTAGSSGTTTYSASVGGLTAKGTLGVSLEAMTHATLGVGPAFYGGGTLAFTPPWIFDYDNVICY